MARLLTLPWQPGRFQEIAMAKMLATSKMPRGVLQRYRTRMMTADGDTFDEPSAKWSRFYAQHGWATEVVDEPAPTVATPRRRRGRPAKADAKPIEERTVPELREMAEEQGVELPGGYVRKDELVEMIEEAGDDRD